MDKNRLIMEFGCDARNEAVARVVVAAMLTRTNPTLSEVEDVKTAVSEAVTNSIIHGYGSGEGSIILEAHRGAHPVHNDHRSRLRHRECRQSHGAALHHCHGRKQIGHGIFIYGGFHG